MKKKCDGCRALNTIFSPRCDLGFGIEKNKEYEGLILSWKPVEECPKPKTINEYYYYYGLKTKGIPI